MRNVADVLSRPAVVFVALFAAYTFAGMIVSYSGVMDHNAFFGADNARAYGDLTRIGGDHYRIKVHPLFLLLVQPVILSVDGIVNRMPLSVLLVESACAAGTASFLSAILCEIGVGVRIRTCSVAVLGLSFSSFVFAAAPETFVFAGFGLSAFWWYAVVLSKGRGGLSRAEAAGMVLCGVACFGVTLTNYASFLIGLVFVLRSRGGAGKARAFLAVNLGCAAAVVALAFAQHAVWPGCPLFWDSVVSSAFGGAEYEEFRYTSLSFGAGKAAVWLKETMLYPLIAPDVVSASSAYGELVLFSGYGLLPETALACFYAVALACLAFRVVAAVREGGWDAEWRAVAFVALAWGANMALHFFYGHAEAFMYSPHYLFLLSILLAFAFDGVRAPSASRILVAALLLFVVVEAVSNLSAMLDVARYAAQMLGTPIPWKKAAFVAAFAGAVAALLVWRGQKALARRGRRRLVGGAVCSYVTVVFLVCVFVFVSY